MGSNGAHTFNEGHAADACSLKCNACAIQCTPTIITVLPLPDAESWSINVLVLEVDVQGDRYVASLWHSCQQLQGGDRLIVVLYFG